MVRSISSWAVTSKLSGMNAFYLCRADVAAHLYFSPSPHEINRVLTIIQPYEVVERIPVEIVPHR